MKAFSQHELKTQMLKHYFITTLNFSMKEELGFFGKTIKKYDLE